MKVQQIKKPGQLDEKLAFIQQLAECYIFFCTIKAYSNFLLSAYKLKYILNLRKLVFIIILCMVLCRIGTMFLCGKSVCEFSIHGSCQIMTKLGHVVSLGRGPGALSTQLYIAGLGQVQYAENSLSTLVSISFSLYIQLFPLVLFIHQFAFHKMNIYENQVLSQKLAQVHNFVATA